MTFDLGTLANLASLLCLPATITAAAGWFATLFAPSRNFMLRFPVVPGLIIALAILVAVIDVAARAGWLNPGLQAVYDKTYTNQVVDIDGHDFTRCEFNNVTIKYSGGSYVFRQSHFNGVRFETPNTMIANSVGLLKTLGFLEPHFAESWKHLPPEYFR